MGSPRAAPPAGDPARLSPRSSPARARRAVHKALRERAVGVDAAVAQEWPVRARELDLVEIALDDHDKDAVTAILQDGNNLAYAIEHKDDAIWYENWDEVIDQYLEGFAIPEARAPGQMNATAS